MSVKFHWINHLTTHVHMIHSFRTLSWKTFAQTYTAKMKQLDSDVSPPAFFETLCWHWTMWPLTWLSQAHTDLQMVRHTDSNAYESTMQIAQVGSKSNQRSMQPIVTGFFSTWGPKYSSSEAFWIEQRSRKLHFLMQLYISLFQVVNTVLISEVCKCCHKVP